MCPPYGVVALRYYSMYTGSAAEGVVGLTSPVSPQGHRLNLIVIYRHRTTQSGLVGGELVRSRVRDG
jgi:hypothetical protein